MQSQQSRRRQIIRACKARRGWTLQPAALEGIEAFVQQGNNANNNGNNSADMMDMVFQLLDPHMQQGGKKTITADIVEASLGHNDEYDDDDDDYNLLRQPRQQHRRGGPSRQPLSSVQQQQRRSGGTGGGGGGGTVYKSSHRNQNTTGGPSMLHDDSSNSSSDLTVVSAFDCPKLVYHQLKKNFLVQENNNNNKTWSLFGTAEDKVDMLAQRYALVHQRILRNDLFRPSDLGRQLQRGNTAGNQHHKLTPIESLLGRRSATTTSVSSASAPLLLLGMLVQLEEGHYYLEDPTGQVPVSFAQLSTATDQEDFFVTEQAILLVEGTARDGIFYIHRLGHPLLEQRQTSLRAIQQQVHHPAYYLPNTSSSISSASGGRKKNFVVLSDVYMDQPQVLSRLEGLFASYENFSPRRLPLFCLMGNFSSPGSRQQQGGSMLEGCMEELASLVTKFPNLARHAHFVIIPGPRDYEGSAGALLPMPRPRPSSTSPMTKAVQHVHVGSNPCRIRWEGREVVLFRYDLLQLLQREQLSLASSPSATEQKATAANYDGRMQVDGDGDDTSTHTLPHCRLIKTILDQGHLVPVAGVPIYWQYDHALRLYPLPDVLVLGLDARPGDEQGAAVSSKNVGGGTSSSSSFDEIYEECHVLHPGSISAPSNASYATVEMTRAGTNQSHKKKKNTNTSDDSSSNSSSDDEDDDGVDTRIIHIGGLSQEE